MLVAPDQWWHRRLAGGGLAFTPPARGRCHRFLRAPLLPPCCSRLTFANFLFCRQIAPYDRDRNYQPPPGFIEVGPRQAVGSHKKPAGVASGTGLTHNNIG